MPHPGPDSAQGLFAPENLSNPDTGFSATESRQIAWEPPVRKGAELGVGFSELASNLAQAAWLFLLSESGDSDNGETAWRHVGSSSSTRC